MRKSVWLINFLIIGALSLHAQPRHSFNSFTRENGLTCSTIQDMAQDRAGCLWLASWGGLYRFDGERFDNFKTTALNERGNPRSNRFIQIEEDGEGRIWTLAFDNSLYYMEPREGVLHLSEVPGVTFSRIFKLVGGEICIAATDNSFFFPDFGEGGDSSGFVRIRNIPAGASLNALYKDRKGYLWSLTGSGLYRDTDLIDPAPVYCALERPDDMLFGSDDGTVLSFRDGSVQHSASRLKNRITLLAQVPGRDDLLLGSTDEGPMPAPSLIPPANSSMSVTGGATCGSFRPPAVWIGIIRKPTGWCRSTIPRNNRAGITKAASDASWWIARATCGSVPIWAGSRRL